MRRGKSRAALAAVLLLAACGSNGASSTSSSSAGSGGATGSGSSSGSGSTSSSGSTSGNSGSSGSGCTITLSGAFGATDGCMLFSAKYDSANNTGVLSVQSAAPTSSVSSASFAVNVTGDLAESTYDFSTSAVTLLEGSCQVPGGTNKAWTASLMDSEGSMSVHITSLTLQTQSGSDKTYAAHGTIDATMVPNSAATADGNLIAHVDF